MTLAISNGGPLPDDADHPATLGEALLRAARCFPEAGLHLAPDRFLAYPDLLAAAGSVLTGLRAAGARPGDYAVLRLGDDEYFPVFWGCVLAGVVPVTAGPPASYEQPNPGLDALRHAWEKLGRPMVIGGRSDLPGLRGLPLSARLVEAAGLLAAEAGAPALSAGPDDVAMVQLSSGSTGVPKLVQITHRGVSEYAVGARVLLDIGSGDVLVNWLPLDHVAGLVLYHLGGVFVGASSVQAATEPVLADPLRWLDLLERYQATHGWAPNFAYRLVTDALQRAPGRRWDLSRLRRLVSGGEQCTPDTFAAFVAATAEFGVTAQMMTPGWGMSETCTGITFCSYGDPRCEQGQYLSVGPPAPGAVLRVVGEDGTILQEGQVGRLQVSSARVTPGYLGDAEADEAAFPEPGWLDTGDLAYLRGGWLTVTGRRKDLVVINGHNYPCHEIEAAALEVAGIAERLVAACGVPDERTGTEQLIIFYAPAEGADHARVAGDVTAAVATRLRLPVAQVVAVAAADFPRTSAGKVQRSRLRQRFVDRSGQATTSVVRAAVLRTLSEFVDGPVDPRRPFAELGLGSVQLVQVRARLERALGRPVGSTSLFDHPTAEALAAHLAESGPGAVADARTQAGAGAAAAAGAADTPGPDRRIAVVGMAGRFPGAPDVDRYWANLCAGVSSVRRFSAEELVAAGVAAETARDPGFVGASGVLDDITGFDAGVFGISAREAELLDPQHRLFLETCLHALEHAGMAGSARPRTGLYAGSGMNLYPHHTYLRHQLAAAAGSTDPATSVGAALGNQPDFLATRVAYRLGLTGPAVNVQAACSTSLVAVHLAVQALLTGEAEVALAGAAAVHVPQVTGYHYSPDAMLSPDGTCRPFDIAAAGTVGGNGVAVLVLKPLAAALADGDSIHAVLLATAINNDGAGKIGFTAPSVAGQTEVIGMALRRAGIAASSVGYIEAHGTGTALGDPIEFEALSRAYPTGSRHLGSVKANIGHLDSCAGMAGLIKAIMVVRDGIIPPQLNFTQANPAIDLAGRGFRIAVEPTAWPAAATPRRAGISSLGVGGTNAHVIVEQPPPRTAPLPGGEAPGLLPLSAADPAALDDLISVYPDSLAGVRHADAVHTAATGRRHHRCRAVALGASTPELIEQLRRPGGLVRGHVPVAGPEPLAYGFPGQGGALTDAAALAARFTDYARHWSLLPADLSARVRAGDRRTDALQPALVAAGLGMWELLRAWGVEPAYVVGHSVGELAALAAAGALTAADAVTLAGHRGRLMRQLMPPGAMAAVFASRAEVQALIAAAPGLELAAANAPGHFVVAGPEAAVESAAARGLRLRRLPVDRAFHTAAVERMLAELRDVLGRTRLRAIGTPFVSTLDGQLREPGWTPGVDYLCEQARRPVLFDQAVTALATAGCTTAVAIGPGAMPTAAGGPAAWIAAQPGGGDPVAGLWQALAELYCRGVEVDWTAVTRHSGGRRVPLPRYQFQRRTHWTGEPATEPAAEPAGAALADRVRTMTAASLGVAAEQVGPDDSFLGLGADSLLLVSLSRQMHDAFGVRIPVWELFGELDTPARLAAAVAARSGAAAASVPPGRDPAPNRAGAAPHRVYDAGGLPDEPVPTAGRPPSAVAGTSAEDPVLVEAQDPVLVEVVRQQLDVMRRQLDLLGAAGADLPVPVSAISTARQAPSRDAPSAIPAEPIPAEPIPAATTGADADALTGPAGPEPRPPAGEVDISLYFFGDYAGDAGPAAYRMILDAAQFADQHGLHAVWIPERHFHSFGGLFPNPSVLAAAIAARTERIRINAGSVVLPLHHPIRVAEEWSVVDNLSGGRIGLGVASGWHADDFVFHPEHYGRHKQVMWDHLDTVLALWHGAAVPARSGSGDQVTVRLFPRPVQAEPPLFTAVVGNPDSYRLAARRGVGIVTNLMTQDLDRLAENIALYRATRAEHGLDPAAGRVVLLLHTYLGDDLDTVRRQAFDPFCAYLRSSLSLLGQVANSLGMNIDPGADDDDVRFVLSRAYRRYCDERALIGTVDSSRPVLEAALAAGVDEVAAFVDFGLPAELVAAGLPSLDRLRRAARRLATAPRRGAPSADATVVERAPLSAGQRRLWLTEQLEPGQPAYNEAAAVRLDGPLDPAVLHTALTDVVARHAPLRTRYRLAGDLPVQEVLAQVPVNLPVVDCAAQETAAVRDTLARESSRVFDLAAGQVFAFTLLRFTPTRHVLVLSFHHIAMDGRSYAVLAADVSACYRARTGRAAALAPLPTTYPRYAHEQTADPAARDVALAYWRQRLAAAPAPATVPCDLRRPAHPSAAGHSVFHELPAELTTAVHEAGRAHRVTAFTVLLSAFAVAVSRMSGQHDLVIGTGVTSRTDETADLIGFFVDTVPLRIDVDAGQTFATLLGRVQRDAADAYAHLLPFDQLVAELAVGRERGHHPFFDIVVEYETGGAFPFDLPGVTATVLDAGLDKSPADLVLYLSHGATVRCHVEHRTDVLDEPTVRRLLALFEQILAAAVGAAGLPLRELPAARSVLSGPVTATVDEQLGELFLRQAEHSPDAVAVVDGGTRWTYDRLRSRARALAEELDVEAGEIVAVALPRSPELIAAQLAVLLSDCAFLPLDPAEPPARLRGLVARSGARVVVTAAGVTRSDAAPRRIAGGAAWCVYTSGSTGQPKAVVVPHRAAVNTVRWHVRELGLSPADRVAHGLALGFDANLAEIYPALTAGATVHLVPDEVRADPVVLADWWAEHRITTAFLTTPVAELLFTRRQAVAVRTLVVGGSRLRRRPPAGFGARVLNAYGPTENAIVTSAGTVAADATGPIDIGRPIDNVTVHLCDRDGTPVVPGAVGELCVSGRNLALGYLDDPDHPSFHDGRYRTGDLARWRTDGTLDFVGRIDEQVKIAGHRVEPAEVSAVLASVPGVEEAVVVARHDHSDPYLAAYVVGPDPRSALADLLPGYLIPRSWTFLDALPLNNTGKVDTAALPAPQRTEAGPAPQTGAERRVHDVWCAELGLDRIPVDVSFYQAGGDSLTAMRVANRLGTAVHTVLRAAGIRDLAARLEPQEVAPATYQQEQMWRRHLRAPDPATAHIALRIDITGPLDVAALRRALDLVVSRHAPLRTWLVERDGNLLQQVHAHRTLTMPVVDIAEGDVADWCVRQGRARFTEPPLLRAAAARVAEQEWVVLLTVHHVAADGWSMLNLTEELQHGYRSFAQGKQPALPALPTTYPQYGRAQRTADVDSGLLAHWRERLAGAPSKLLLPTDRPRPARTTQGAEFAFTVPAQLSARLRELANDLGTSLYTVLAAGYATLLSRRTGSDDIVLATPHAHRDDTDVEPLVGLFASTIPVRLRPAPGRPFGELVREADAVLAQALQHQPLYLPQLYLQLDPNWSTGQPSPISDHLFAWHPPMPRLDLPGLQVRLAEQPLACARRDLALALTPDGEGLRGAVEYSVDLFDGATINAFCAEYTEILDRVS
jgi:natural product biosynthesis luciferase-like monooxygenase protein/amino acid adenylation domain-containing protein